MKRRKTKVLIVIVLLCVIVTGGLYLYLHPIQWLVCVNSGNVQYPNVTYHSYRFFHVPDNLREHSEEFNEGVFQYVKELEEEYGDSLSLNYSLEKNKDGTKVIFNGEGTDGNDKVININETLEFDIVIRPDAKVG